MIKFIFITSSFLIASVAGAQCQNKINPLKVNLFVDTNHSEPEIRVAQEAACLRGEAFEVIPQNYQSYKPLIKKAEYNRAIYRKCEEMNKGSGLTHQADKDPCLAQYKNYQTSLDELTNFKAKQVPLKDQFEKRMIELKANQMKITSMSISGHDGGGHFGGDKGSLSRSEVGEIINKYPELNEVQSLLLLGCYTGVTKEVNNWRSIFPKVKLIGGYDGQAPLSHLPQGHDYIKDILLSENRMLTLKNDKTVDADLKRMLAGIENLRAAVWVDPFCSDDDKGFYYASLGDRKFHKLEPNACDNAVKEINLIAQDFEKYNSGELEPPKETGQGTPLRRIYEKIRSHEHCLEYVIENSDRHLGINDSAVFNLLFWHGVKQNFAEYYEDDMKKAQEILNNIDLEKIIKKTEELIEGITAKSLETQKILEEFKNYPEKVKVKIQSEYNALDVKIRDFEASEQGQKIVSTPENHLNPDELILFNNYQQNIRKRKNLEYNLVDIEDGNYSTSLREDIQYQNSRVEDFEAKLSSLKNDPSAFKKTFAPTKAVIGNKSRKEILENVHTSYKFLDLPGLSPREKAALSFIGRISDTHFRFYENPFSWHEYTGDKPEPPANASEQTLDAFTKRYSSRAYMSMDDY